MLFIKVLIIVLVKLGASLPIVLDVSETTTAEVWCWLSGKDGWLGILGS